jgi:hypothetical protein
MSPMKPDDDWHIQHDKKINYIISFGRQMAKEKLSQENPSYPTTGNFRGGG